MVLDISEIEYLFIVLELSEVKYLFFLLFVYVGMAWIVKLSGLTLANKPLNDLHAREDTCYSRSFMRKEMQELVLNVLHELSKKVTKSNTWHANQIHASFLLAKMETLWPQMLAIFFDLTSFMKVMKFWRNRQP